METLSIYLFGTPEVTLEGQPLHFPSVKTLLLFCYLVLHRHKAHSRAALAGLFWGDSPEVCAQKSLRTALWRLRSLLEPKGVLGGTYLILDRGSVRFNPESRYWLDVQQFEQRLASSSLPEDFLAPGAAQPFEEAVALYRGNLLEGHYVYWALQEQDRLKLLLLERMEMLVDRFTQAGDYRRARAWAQRALAIDPTHEILHRNLMLLALRSGDRPGALRQYRICADVLRREFGIEPMDDTTSLYRHIQSDGSNRAPPAC